MSKKLPEISKLPSLMGIPEFPNPTAAMMKFALAWLQPSKLDMPPYKILISIGLSGNLLYKWRPKPGFEIWLRQVADEHHINFGLAEVNRACKREALKNSAQDRKLYNELYNPSYKPRTAVDLDVGVNKGRRPPDEDIQEVIKRRNKRIEEFHKQCDEQTIEKAIESGEITKEEAFPGRIPPNNTRKTGTKFVTSKTVEQGKDEPKLS